MTTDPLVAALRAALPLALRARDTEATSALRTALAAVANAEAVDVPGHASSGPDAVTGSDHVAGAVLGVGAAEVERRALTPTEVRGIVEHEVRERLVAAQGAEGAAVPAYADRLRREAEALQRVLDAVPA
jgi:uncharacterized protein YqeY